MGDKYCIADGAHVDEGWVVDDGVVHTTMMLFLIMFMKRIHRTMSCFNHTPTMSMSSPALIQKSITEPTDFLRCECVEAELGLQQRHTHTE